MNLLYYDALDLKKEQLGADDFGPASFAWVKNTKFYPWLETGSATFWIQGKPASGKSTLMKYLSESQTTYDALHRQGGDWKILQFFFDYRAGKNTANHVLGLLKLFIRLLVKQIPELAEHLTDGHTRRKLAGEDANALVEILTNLVRSSKSKVCAFIDGLDEYDGDDWELCSKLEVLRDRTGMKLCLASRPEAAFAEHYAKVPTLVMQEHNLASINIYIRSKIARFRSLHPFQNHLFPDTLQMAIAEKSQGVMLWARLVVDEMLKKCDISTSPEDLTVYLDVLPTEMEPLYERILGKADPDQQQEASILLMLIDEDTQSLSSTLILQAWKYIETSCLAPGALPLSFDHDACVSRAKALLGGLVDAVGLDAECRQTTLRLLHKSLSTYLRRSSWLTMRLPGLTRQRYPNNVWNRLTFQVLSQAPNESAVHVEPLISDYKRELNKASKPYQGRPIVNHKRDDLALCYQGLQSRKPVEELWVGGEEKAIEHFESLIEARSWSPFSTLLWYCINHVSQIDHSRIAKTLLFVHLTRCYHCNTIATPLTSNNLLLLYSENHLSWLVAVCHQEYNLALVYLQADETNISHDTLEAMFDILVRSETAFLLDTQEMEELEELTMYFADKSITIDSHHLCLIDQDVMGFRTLNLFVSQRPTTTRVSCNHHARCPYRYTGVGLIHHLSGLKYIPSNLLKNAYGALLGDMNGATYKNGKHIFHRTLCMHEGARRKNVTIFIALAQAGVQPDVTGGPNDLISYAISQRRKLRVKLLVRHRKSHLAFLQEAIQALKEYTKNENRWGENRWGDLTRLREIDYHYLEG